MKHIAFSEDTSSVNTAILIKTDSMIKQQLEYFYVKPIEQLGIARSNLIAFDLFYNSNGKVSAKEAKDYIQNLLKALTALNIKTLIVADSTYFKYLTGLTKTTNARGYTHKCSIHPYKELDIILSTNYTAIYHNENMSKDLDRSLILYSNHMINLGLGISTQASTFNHTVISSEQYPSTVSEIQKALNTLHKYHTLTFDIETFSLRFEKAGIGTIGFAWDKHNGICFEVDNLQTKEINLDVRNMLKNFFMDYKGKLIAHNALFDVKILVYQLFMEHDTDFKGLREGLKVFSNVDDSMVIAFLATNTTVDNPLGLKELAYDYVGDYSEDVKDITKVNPQDLMKYNLIDCLATWYVYDKYLPVVHEEDQWNFYQTIAKPSLFTSIQMMLTGLPMNMSKVVKAKTTISLINMRNKSIINNHPAVAKARFINNRESWVKANAKLKKKVRPITDFNDEFNPNSDLQLRTLLYEVLKLPVLDTTDSGLPSTSSKVIKRLLKVIEEPETVKLLKALLGVAETEIIINTFLTAFEEYAFTRKGYGSLNNTIWLNGDLKTTGTKSGRLSSSSP